MMLFGAVLRSSLGTRCWKKRDAPNGNLNKTNESCLDLHEGRSRSETTIFYNEKRRFPTCSLQNEIGNQSETTIFFWGNRCMCIFIKVETARKPLFFTMKNADSRFGEYITLSNREGKPVACYASAVLWGTTTGPITLSNREGETPGLPGCRLPAGAHWSSANQRRRAVL